MEGSKLHANISSIAEESCFYDVDLLTEILCRLPSKSLVRFKSVCKSWRTLITNGYFCLLWRKHHRGPGLLLTSLLDHPHCYIPLSGPTAGVTQFKLRRDVCDHVVQSCNGFLLRETGDGIRSWVCNPATSEVVVLPSQLDACKIHARDCNCIIRCPSLAFDSYSRGRVVALAQGRRRRKHRFVYQVCVTGNQGEWRSSSKPFRSKHPMFGGVHWHNFVVWLNKILTLFYDVGEEVLRVGAPPPPPGSTTLFLYHLGESGGHLHFIHDQGSHLIINEMKHDLSGWFVKHNIELSQIEASLFRSVGWVRSDFTFKVHSLIEEKEDSTLVLACHNDVVLYRIQDHKSSKICEFEFNRKRGGWLPHYRFYSSVIQHVETLSQFHEQ